MATQNKAAWIDQGYQLVAEMGFEAVNIELISRFVNKNKSSFYHYFGDFELYRQALLEHHIARAQDFSGKIRQITTINPDLLNVAIEYKYDIFFHKQLRLNRNKPLYAEPFQKAFAIYEAAVIDKWATFFRLEDNLPFVSTCIHFFTENLLLKATFENFTFEWLEGYLEELSTMVQQFSQKPK
ncbi:MAG: TetR/AcrR family transcriptional regulator [Bacteroidota bacterium]